MFPVRSCYEHPFYNNPSRMVSQNFGAGMWDEDLMHSSLLPIFPHHRYAPFHHNLGRLHLSPQQNGFSEVQCSKDKFEVKIDVHQFAPEEVRVTNVDNYVIVEGKHEEKEDSHGFISRQFKRRYLLPDNVKTESVVCNLSSDGVLMITVPRVEAITDATEKVLPITQTGIPAISNNGCGKSCAKTCAKGVVENGKPEDEKKN